MANKTYYGQTANKILNTAEVKESEAGLAEIFVRTKKNGVALAFRGTRKDFTGCEVQDVLVLRNFDGVIARLRTTQKSLNKLIELESLCAHFLPEEF